MKKKTPPRSSAPTARMNPLYFDMAALATIIVICLAVYGRCIAFKHTLYDDPSIIFENPQVMAGLTWESIRWALLHPNYGLYMALPTLSFMLDRNLFDDWDGGYHFMTLLWHILCACSFYLVMSRLFQRRAPVFAAALLVAIHPVQSMTVNWISARNEIMPAFFMLWSLDMYRRYSLSRRPAAEQPPVPLFSRRPLLFYGLSAWFMFLGVISKQGIVLLPAVLLLLDYWPLRRIDLNPRKPLQTLGRAAVLTIEKAPWFALSGLAVFLAIYGKRDFGAFQGERLLTPLDNLGFAFTAYVRYLGHLIYPENYIMAYAVNPAGPAWWMIAGSFALLTSITLICLVQVWKRPWLLVFWSWFVLFLLPVSGLVRYANESIALRYLYTPGMGLYLLAGFGLFALSCRIQQAPPLEGEHAAPRIFWGMLLVFTLALGGLTFRQSGFWRDAETLAQRALTVTRGKNATAHNHLGVLRGRQNLRQQSLEHMRQAMLLEPDRVVWVMNYAISLNKQQRYEETLALTTPLLEKHPDYIVLLTIHGGALTGLMQFDAAMPFLEKTLSIEPRYVPANYNYGLCLLHTGRKEEARTYFERALAEQPTHQSAKKMLETLSQAP